MEFVAPLARLLLYGGATVAIGRAALGPFEVSGAQRAVRRALWGGTIALVVAPIALLLLQQQALELTAAELPGLLRDTSWGRGWWQLAIPCGLSALVLPMRRTRTTGGLILVAALGVAAAMGGLGHASADEQWPVVSRLLDALHVLGVGAWIGGLLLMLLAGAGNGLPTANEWRAFSRTATVMAPVVLLSGVGSSWRRVGASEPAVILASDYGQLLLLKIVLAVAVLAMGFTQRRRIAAGEAPTRRVILREVILASAVLGATAWMTGMEPPGS